MKFVLVAQAKSIKTAVAVINKNEILYTGTNFN